MNTSPKGKYVNVDTSNPKALGICDYSGFVFNRCDLVRQMEWRGNALVWNGFFVGRPFADKPNEQGRPPILPPDPVPVKYARPPQGQTVTWSSNPFGPWVSMTDNTWASLSSLEEGNFALPENQRLSQMQNYYWGA